MDKHIPQELYNEIIRNVPIACVDVVIIHSTEALLVKRKDPPANGKWWVPGGRVFKGELMSEAAKRKCSEEVGLDCRIGPIIHTAETIFGDGPCGIPVHSINACFLAYPEYGYDPILDGHHKDYFWISSIKDKRNLHPYVIDCLKAAGF